MTLHKKTMWYKGNGHRWSTACSNSSDNVRASVLPMQRHDDRPDDDLFSSRRRPVWSEFSIPVSWLRCGWIRRGLPAAPLETPLGRSHVLNLLEGGRKLRHVLYSRGRSKFGSYHQIQRVWDYLLFTDGGNIVIYSSTFARMCYLPVSKRHHWGINGGSWPCRDANPQHERSAGHYVNVN